MATKKVTSAKDFADCAKDYTGSDKRYITSTSKANSFSNDGSSTSNAIGYIEFNDKSVNLGCPLFRIEAGKKGKYEYNMAKYGIDTKYCKSMFTLYTSVSAAGKAKNVTCGSTGNDTNQVCSIGFGNVSGNKKASDDVFWSDAVFVAHRPDKIKELYKLGHEKKYKSGTDYCPCVVVGDNGLIKSGDKYGPFSSKNASSDYHNVGNFATRDKVYIYAVCYSGGTAYGYVAIPWTSWWQKDNTLGIFQGLKKNFEQKKYTYNGWVNLNVIMGDSKFKVNVHYNQKPAAKASGIAGLIGGALTGIKNVLSKLTGAVVSSSSGTKSSNGIATYSNIYNVEKFSTEKVDESPYISIHSIVGMPFNFLASTDIRYGYVNTSAGNYSKLKTGYGKEYIENIIADMPIAVIKPGFANRDNFLSKASSVIKSTIATITSGSSLKNDLIGFINNFVTKDYERFYSFDSQYTTYIAYVNTLCHMFVTFLGIGDKDCPNGKSKSSTYSQYDDSMGTIDSGSNNFTKQFGTSPAVFCYYQPDSSLNQTFSTTTAQSNLGGTASEYSEKMRQYSFFGQALGIDTSEGSLLGGVFESVADKLTGSFLGILGEGAGGILMGSNISLPEIWSDSDTEVSHEIKIKLVSPYGDPESVFLHVLRPMARILALALPRQVGPNTYSSPFIVQAFSKGQFNCQLGIISSLAIERGGNGGESHTIHHLPTEINLTVSIQDMYEKVMLSNEYINTTKASIGSIFSSISVGQWKKALGLLFNNIGLMDFIGAYSGYNLNSPSTDVQLQFMANFYKNRVASNVQFKNGKVYFPNFERELIDAFSNVSQKAQSLTKS